MINILYNDLKTLISDNQLVPEEQYCITDYVTTVAKVNYTSAGYKFDIVVTALDTNTLYEYALLTANATETYFDVDALLIFNIRYNVHNIIPGFNNDWVDTNGKGCIYYMVDNKGNEAPFDFKNIKYNGKFLFNSTIDNTDSSQTVSEYNVVREVIEDGYFKLPQVSFNDECSNVSIGTNASEVTITESSNLQIGDDCKNGEFTNVNNTLIGNELSGATLSSIDGGKIGDNNKHIIVTNHTNLIVKDNNTTITLGGGGNGVIIDSNNTNVTIGTNAKDIYINASKEIILGHNVEQFNISSSYNMDVEDDCKLFNLNETNHLTATTGCENINTIKNDYLTLTEEVKNVTVSEGLTNLILDGTKLTGSDGKLIIKQDEKVVVINEQTNSEVVLTEDGTTTSNPNSYITDSPADGLIYGRKDGDWEEIDTSGFITDAYTKAESDGKYETIDNVNILRNIVNENTEDISNKADKATTLAEYGITDAYNKTEVDAKLDNIEHDNTLNKNSNPDFLHITETEKTNFVTASDFVEDFISNATAILYADLLALINNNELIPSSSYRITDYITTTVQADTQSAGHDFDIIVTALDENTLSENANAIKRDGDTYFTNTKVETWELKYCLDNDTNRFAWADSINGKGVIYYMKDENGNECPYDFKNIQYLKDTVWVYTFGGTVDNSLIGGCYNNKIKEYILSNKQTLNNITFGTNCYFNTFGYGCHSNIFGGYCFSNTFGDGCFSIEFGDDCSSNTFSDNCRYITFNSECGSNTFGDSCYSNVFGDGCYSNKFGDTCNSNTFGDYCKSNIFGDVCASNTLGDDCYSNTFGDGCRLNTIGSECGSNTFGISCQSNIFIDTCYSNTFGDACGHNNFGDGCSYNNFGNECNYNTFGLFCISNTFGHDCQSNNFYDGLIGTTPKNWLRYIVLEDGIQKNNFYSELNTSSGFYLQRIRIKGFANTGTPLSTTITLSTASADYNWVVAKNSDGIIEQYCPEDHYLTDAQKTKLEGIAAGAEVNVQSDWNQTTNTADDYIKNKPTIPTVPSDVLIYGTQTLTSTQKTQARTNIGAGTSSFSGVYDDLSNKPTIPTVPSDVLVYGTQTLTTTQKTQARTNIGAGISSFSGSYNDLSNKPNIIPEAPSNNKTYGRKNSAWSEIDTSGGGEYEKIKTITSTTSIILDKQYKIYKYIHSSGNITSFSFSTTLLSDLVSGEAYTFEMEIQMPSGGTSITFPSTIVPLNGTTITLKAGKKNYLAFRTFDKINFIVNYQGFI